MDKDTKTRLIVFFGILSIIWLIIGLICWLHFWGLLIIISLGFAFAAAGANLDS